MGDKLNQQQNDILKAIKGEKEESKAIEQTEKKDTNLKEGGKSEKTKKDKNKSKIKSEITPTNSQKNNESS